MSIQFRSRTIDRWLTWLKASICRSFLDKLSHECANAERFPSQSQDNHQRSSRIWSSTNFCNRPLDTVLRHEPGSPLPMWDERLQLASTRITVAELNQEITCTWGRNRFCDVMMWWCLFVIVVSHYRQSGPNPGDSSARSVGGHGMVMARVISARGSHDEATTIARVLFDGQHHVHIRIPQPLQQRQRWQQPDTQPAGNSEPPPPTMSTTPQLLHLRRFLLLVPAQILPWPEAAPAWRCLMMILINIIICVVTFLRFLDLNPSVRVGHALHTRDSWSQRQHSSPPHGWMYITTLLNAPPLPIQFPDYTTNSTSTSESAPAAVLKHYDDRCRYSLGPGEFSSANTPLLHAHGLHTLLLENMSISTKEGSGCLYLHPLLIAPLLMLPALNHHFYLNLSSPAALLVTLQRWKFF